MAPLSGAQAAKVSKPGKVTTVKASSKNDTLTVSWRKGTGGTPTSYIATLTPSGKKCTTSKTTCSFTKLTNGTKYKISIVAKNSAGSSAAVTATWTVAWSTKTSVSLSLSLSSQSTFANTPITATAILNPATSGGTISFSVNGSAYSSCANVPVVSDRASCSISEPTVGTYEVRASFSGVGTFLASNSAATSFVVVARSTSVVLASDRTVTTHGDLTTFTAAVQPIPNGGTVSFFADGKPIPSCVAVTVDTATGLATCQYTFDTTGSRAVAAAFSGSSNYSVSSSSIDITVNKIVTSLVLLVTSDSFPIKTGQKTTLMAVISPIPDGGTVSFTADGNSIPSCSAVTFDRSTGWASCQYVFTSSGSRSLAAGYSGSSNYAVSSSTEDLTVNKASPSLVLTSSKDPVLPGQSTTLTAKISPVPDGGTVSFTADGNPITSCSAVTVNTSTGLATCEYEFTSPGSPLVAADYSGSSNYAISSSSIHITVNKLVTSLALTVSDNPAEYGKSTTLTAKISPIPDGGTVSFTVDANSIPSCSAVTVNTSTGLATCQYAFTSSGSRTVVATYSASSNYAVSWSSINVSVNKVVTSLALTVGDNHVQLNKSTALTAKISSVPDGGTVSFRVDGNPIPSCSTVTVNASTGVATCQYVFTATGSRSVAADYSGSSNYTVSTASIDITVNKVVTSLALTVSDNPVESGQTTTLTATISPIPDGGTVSFSADANSIASCSAVTVNTSTGLATCQFAFSATGSRSVVATYSGSSNYAVSSSSINVTVNKVETSLLLASSKNPVLPGQSSTLTATVSPIPDGGTVSFTADGNPITSCSAVTVNTSTGLATCNWLAEPFQAANLSATYSGTSNYAAKTANTILQDVKMQTVFWNSPGKDTFTVPAGWTKILVAASGAQGSGDSSWWGNRNAGGRGGIVNAVITVTPGQELQVNVGAVGGGGSGLSYPNVWASGSGGGATTLTSGNCTLSSLENCLVVAAGGGGGGVTFPREGCYPLANGSDGGAIWNGENFASGATALTYGCWGGVNKVYGGGGGTTASTAPGYNGTFGHGANAQSDMEPPGGGGDGFWGGSSGGKIFWDWNNSAGGDGGAGGSSYVTTASTQFSFLESKQYGSGSMSITNVSYSTDTSTRLDLSSSSTTAGIAITATATVTPGTTGGTVGFWVNGSLYPSCSAVAVISGQASCSITKTTVGDYNIQAAYSGVKINLPSISAIQVLKVNVNRPKVTLVSSESTPSASRTITLTSNISPIPDGGNVTFYNNDVELQNCVAVPVDLSTGNVNCQYRVTSTAANSFTATYAGTSNFGNSKTTTPLSLVVSKAETSLVLTTSKNPIGPGQKTTLTATLSLVPDGGTVTFKSDGVAIALCSAVAVDTTTGIATCSWVPDPYQDSMLSATYSGTTSYSASTSNTVQQKVS